MHRVCFRVCFRGAGWRTLTVSKGCPSRVTVIPPHVPANTSFADFTSVFCSSLLGSAPEEALKPLKLPKLVTPAPLPFVAAPVIRPRARSAGVTRMPGASSTERKLLRCHNGEGEMYCMGGRGGKVSACRLLR
jgi:hypothetical protein